MTIKHHCKVLGLVLPLLAASTTHAFTLSHLAENFTIPVPLILAKTGNFKMLIYTKNKY